MEQARAEAEYASWDKTSSIFNPDPAYNVPETLLYTEQPSAHEKEMSHYLQQVEEAQARAADKEEETIEISSDSSSEWECGSPYQGGEADEDYFNFDDDDSDDSGTRGGGGEDTVPFIIGEMVMAHGLISTSYNGRIGFVRSNLEDSRHSVELSPDFTAARVIVRIKPENLSRLNADPTRVMEAVLFVPRSQPEQTKSAEYKTYPQYAGDPSDMLAMSIHALKGKAFMRKQVQHRAKKVANAKAKEYGNSEFKNALSWVPPDISQDPTAPVIGTIFNSRWEAEMFMRHSTASVGAQGGIVISKNNVKITGSCPLVGCKFKLVADLQPSNGSFKLNKSEMHKDSCFGVLTPADGATSSEKALFCKSAYTPAQVARRFQSEFAADPALTAKRLGDIISRSKMYLRCPDKPFIRAVLEKVAALSVLGREIEMAALPGMADILASYGHKVGTIDIARCHLAM
jgi:hypothetical protein